MRAFNNGTTSAVSTVTGVKRWGIPLNGVNSTRLGSINKSRNSEGEFSAIKQETIVFKHTLFPLPVAPATNKWGMFIKSKTTSSPPVLLPSAIARDPDFDRLPKLLLSITDLIVTREGLALGTSIPTNEVPSTGDSMRIEEVCNARARSFSRCIIVSTFTRVLDSTFLLTILPASSNKALPLVSVAFSCLYFLIQPGSIPYIVTVGPGLVIFTSTSTP